MTSSFGGSIPRKNNNYKTIIYDTRGHNWITGTHCGNVVGGIFFFSSAQVSVFLKTSVSIPENICACHGLLTHSA